MIHNVALLYIFLLCTCSGGALQAPSRGAGSVFCDRVRFGTPNPEDCKEAMFWIPYHNKPASTYSDAKAFRLYVEPRRLDPPFRDVKDPYPPRAIVQMPRIWKYGMLAQLDCLDNEIWDITCRAALI